MRERGAAFVERMWQDRAGVAGRVVSTLLLPAELAFRGASAVRNRAYASGRREVVHATVPVVSIGNIAIGGAGKTPFSAFLARRLTALGHTPALLHGGYADDEPLLHRRWNPGVPVYVGRDRVVSARAAADAGASVLILDDGFQHRRLARDIDLVLVAAETWTRAPRLLPRGPWRESSSALRRATAVVVTYRTPLDPAHVRSEIQKVVRGVPVWIARMTPERWRRAAAMEPGDGWGGAARHDTSISTSGAPTAPALLVTAIAQPGLLETGANATGARIDDVLTFRDHHAYTAADAERILTRASGRAIVTTAKDWVKLDGLLDPASVWVLEQEVRMDEGDDALDRLLATLAVRNA